jgi:hypothetical protein
MCFGLYTATAILCHLRISGICGFLCAYMSSFAIRGCLVYVFSGSNLGMYGNIFPQVCRKICESSMLLRSLTESIINISSARH